MKEIKCSARTKMGIFVLVDVFLCMIIIFIFLLNTPPSFWMLMGVLVIYAGYALLLQILEYVNLQIVINENGIIYQNRYKVIRQYEWKNIDFIWRNVIWDKIIFKAGRKKVVVYSYYKNQKQLHEWLLQENKYTGKKKFKPSKKFVLCTAIITCILLVPISYHMYCHYAVGRFEHYLNQGDMEKALAQVEKMPDVNMLDSCKPIYFAKQVATMGAANRGYPLYWAAYKKADIRVMEALLEKGADPNLGEYSTTPFEQLHSMRQKDMYEKIQLFLDYGADISSVGMYFAGGFEEKSKEAKENEFRINELLWESGVDDIAYRGTKFERTVLHEAVMFLDSEYLEKLYHNENRSMEHLLNVKDADGETPIFEAVRYDDYDICQFLIQEGADLTVKNKEGKTAYDVAVELGYEDCARLLKEEER